MRNLFNSVPRPPIRYNKFNLSAPNFFTADYGTLYPCLCREVNGGEVIRDFSECMVRTMPMRCPAFVRSDYTVHYFFVPNRLVYEDWTKFIVRGDDGNTDYDKPYITLNGFKDIGDPRLLTNGSLADYLNFPTFPVGTTLLPGSLAKIDMMPFSAYSLIYNEYYRDENLIPEVFIWKSSGMTDNVNAFLDYVDAVAADMDDPTSEATHAQALMLANPMELRNRAWRKDYFTSALPFVQKGVPISLAGSVSSVTGTDFVPLRWFSASTYNSATRHVLNWFGDGTIQGHGGVVYEDVQNRADLSTGSVTPRSSLPSVPATQGVYAILDLPMLQSSVMTISDLRVGLALQQWFELNARTGSDRYFEYLLGHFGVRDRDARLQRPEYLGGFSAAMQISEVEQTSSSDGTTPQGNLAGKGLGFSASHPVRYRFPEPGFIMAIFSIRPHAVYYKGLPRMYQRWDAFDYFDPLFDHLSEQPIWQSELDYDWSIVPQSTDDEVFGYTPRFAEYRTALPECHGDFRESLNYWISPRKVSDPKLDRDFIEVRGYSQSLYEHFAFIGTEEAPSPHFYVHMQHNISMLRPMSKYATPKL